jgi:hypothetical protein
VRTVGCMTVGTLGLVSTGGIVTEGDGVDRGRGLVSFIRLR